MKTTTLVLILFLTGLDLWAQTPPPSNMPPALRRQLLQRMRTENNNPTAATSATSPSLSSLPVPSPVASAPPSVAPATSPSSTAQENEVPAYEYDWSGVDVDQVLDVYADLVGRTLIRGPLPQASIVLKTEQKLTKTEAIEALQAVLAMNGISIVNMGDKFAKVVQSSDAGAAGGSFNNIPASQLPDLGTYVTHIVQLHYVKPSVMKDIIMPFAKLKDIIALDDNGILIIRDYAENVKRMLQMIQDIDVNVPQEYVSEVIPILYAQADDIANALNSLGGSGTATVSFGTAPARSTVSGLSGNSAGGTSFGTGLGGTGNTYQPGGINQSQSPFGTQATSTPNGTPSQGSTFQDRLRAIINRASSPGGGNGQQQIQVFGTAKIIADERSNSLLVFATRADMERIKHVVSQLDVLLSQVLIESAIIDYSLGPNTLNFGVSAAQNPQTITGNPSTQIAGGINNGQTFLNFLTNATGSVASSGSSFASALPGGLSYFGNIGPNWDVAMTAAAADSHASIVQTPSIMTSQAKPAQFFVGNTVPYVTGNTYGSAYGNTASYSQLSVGVELDVTPFINPDGLVVMDIQQEIDALNGSTLIEGVGNIPNTIKRTLTSEVAVKDRDTIMLGGFIENNKSTSRSGVPVLMDIPILGDLFTSRSDSKQREELVVLMRPTVLRTPEAAAAEAVAEQKRLPGVSQVEAENKAEVSEEIQAEQRAEQRGAHAGQKGSGLFAPAPQLNPVMETNTNAAPVPMP